MYENPWTYKGEIFDESLVDKYYGFVYSITCPDGRMYIGRKAFWFMRKQRGAKRRSKLESDWRKYYGSSEIVKDMVKELGPDKKCLCILADGIRNYLSKFVDDDWMKKNNFKLD